MTPIPLARAAQDAVSAYRTTDRAGVSDFGSGPGPADFGAMISRMAEGAVAAGHEADAQSSAALMGGGDYTHVALAVSRAELALQTTVAVRDRVVQAYQDVMHMAI